MNQSSTNFTPMRILSIVVLIVVIAIGYYLIIYIPKKNFDQNREQEQLLYSQNAAKTRELLNQVEKSQQQKNDDISNWSTYSDNLFSFKYPHTWVAGQKLIRGSGYDMNFNDPTGIYALSFQVNGNYSQMTGQPYKDINDYVGFPYKLDPKVIDGVTGVKTLPRAGSESSFAVSVISKDLKWIINLRLDTPRDGSVFDKGSKLFDQVLSTFKFAK